MENLFSWLDDLTSFLFSLLPHVFTVNANEVAVVHSRGKKTRLCRPGVHWYWPIITDEPETYIGPTVEDTCHFGSQKLTCRDGAACALSLVVRYRVADAIRVEMVCNGIGDTLSDVCSQTLTREVGPLDWNQLLKDTGEGTLQERLLGKVSDRMATFGIQILDVQLKDIVKTRVLSLIGDGFLTPPMDDGDDD